MYEKYIVFKSGSGKQTIKTKQKKQKNCFLLKIKIVGWLSVCCSCRIHPYGEIELTLQVLKFFERAS